MEKIVIIGGKGGAVVVAEQIYDSQIKTGTVEFLGFAFDDESFGPTINGFPVLCKTREAKEKYEKYPDVKFIFQLYRPDLMKERIDLLNSYGIPPEKFATFIHHSCMVAKTTKIGHGAALMANVVVNPNAAVGNHCTIHSNSIVGHDTTLGSHNFVAAHTVFGSSSVVGNGNFFGLNSTLNNYLKIGDFNFIGMASNVIKGLGSNQKVYGNPAKEFHTAVKPL